MRRRRSRSLMNREEWAAFDSPLRGVQLASLKYLLAAKIASCQYRASQAAVAAMNRAGRRFDA